MAHHFLYSKYTAFPVGTNPPGETIMMEKAFFREKIPLEGRHSVLSKARLPVNRQPHYTINRIIWQDAAGDLPNEQAFWYTRFQRLTTGGL